MNKFEKVLIKTMSLLGASCILFGACTINFQDDKTPTQKNENTGIKKQNFSIDTKIENYYNPDVMFKLPDTVSVNDEISVIVSLDSKSVMDAYSTSKKTTSLSNYVQSAEGKAVARSAEKEQKEWLKKLDKLNVEYTLGSQYDTILNGFEITIQAKDFKAVGEFFGDEADLIIGETYMPAVVDKAVTNDVDVYETGIFDSSTSEYQGDGVVVAVLDTGLDYTHSAFSVDYFEPSKERFTLSNISGKVGTTNAARLTQGLTAHDVYVNKKVPYAYDYADKDPDVLPINSEHGTHVAGIIAGKNHEITGVAPNAQLAIMKVFSDMQGGAKSVWILDALEDCATLNVDVINMSLGAGCGFSREEDNLRVNEIYEKIREAGISLIVAAGNDYIATMGSEKNGSLNLTRNPDAGTVGSPSTYGASLCVASIEGVKTPYFKYEDEIIYFTEAHTSSAKTKHFVDDILNEYSEEVGYTVNEHTFEYVTIPGLGTSADYMEDKSYYEGKIMLVKRGITTFEEKVRIAMKEKGAAGIIIYNNVSGSITMSVGKDIGAVCSLTQDEGEKLAAHQTGTITISRNLVAGPFMSDFSSWGPTSDLQIKPEITAHGGEIYSAVPGEGYERLSGTSMACPNQAGATALIRQYVRQSGKFGDYAGELTNVQAQEVTAYVNQLMMSTADIVYNKNGLPYAVRKQGAGLVNITEATTTESFIKTYDRTGALMDRTKFELGDDKACTGVYNMKFEVNNVSNVAVSYDVSSVLLTEGVSEMYTSHGDRTVSQDGRLLDGTVTTVKTVNGANANSNVINVGAGQKAVVEVEVKLSDADKAYISDSFENGMYVEGFILLKAISGGKVDLNVPVLAFFGDWTKAPIFDEEYYDTNKDELNAGLDPEDKLMADTYPTKVTGRLYSEYVGILGEYYFGQNPSLTPISASKEHIAISNQENGKQSAVNSIANIWAGLLRNVKEAQIKIVEDTTGKVVFEKSEYNIRKSNGLSGISPAFIDVEFSALEHELKNNTRYTVTVTSFIEYGDKADQKNVRDVFEFPLYIDFQAPAVTDVKFRTEYDKTTKKTHLFADLQIYDNHYAMGVQVGQILEADEDSDYTFDMDTFGKYVIPVYSNFNSTSTITVELTDYVARLKNSVSMDPDGKVLNNSNSFIAICYDYAMNNSTFEINLPDEVISMYFTEEEIKLSPNETKTLDTLLEIHPMDTWMEVLTFESSNKDVLDVVNQTLIAKQSGEAIVTAIGYNADGEEVTTTLKVKVLSPEDEGYKKYDVPTVNKFTLSGYKVNKAYYSVSGSDRDIGLTDGIYNFGGSYALNMYPSESVTLSYVLDSNFPEKTAVTYKVGNSRVATISDNGTIIAQSEGSTTVSVNVTFDGKPTVYSARIVVSVKDPYKTQGMYLMSYKGLGGEVVIPNDRGIEIIQSYAFSNYEYVDKGPEDIIDDDDPYMIKQMHLGEDTITKVVIPEGVTAIEAYAFAKLTALEEVVLPSTLVKIGVGAFLDCENLKKINLENVKFINKEAFANTKLTEVDLSSIVAIGNYAFQNTSLNYIELPATSQSLGVGAFIGNKYLTSVVFGASKMKIGESAFENCVQLNNVVINASVISKKAFYNCNALANVTIGKDVEVIGEYAFSNTSIATFEVADGGLFTNDANGAILLNNNEVVLVAPKYVQPVMVLETATSIGTGAFTGKTNISKIVANNVTVIKDYAFADCSGLKEIEFDSLEKIGAYAFYGTGINVTPNLSQVNYIGNYAFAKSALTSVTIPSVAKPEDLTIGEYAFADCNSLREVTIGDNVTLAKGAFSSEIAFNNLENFTNEDGEITVGEFLNTYYKPYIYEVKDENGEVVKEYQYYRYDITIGAKSTLQKVTIGENVTLGAYAFDGNTKLTELTIGEGANLGEYAFFNAIALTSVDLSGVLTLGDYAFSGSRILDLWIYNARLIYAYEQKYENDRVVFFDYIYRDYIPAIQEVSLDSIQSIGQYAFANNDALKKVVIGSEGGITEISEGAFANTGVNDIQLSETVKTIAKYAFFDTDISTITLSSVDTIGEYAFRGTALTEITLKEGATLEKGAFENCESLSVVNNLDKVCVIGASAFRNTALTEVNLASAVEVGDFAFGESNVTKVTFNENLKKLGENPFYGCAIATFATEQEIVFNEQVIGTEMVTTYDISETIKVIDDVIYQVHSTGFELVTYPMLKELASYSVIEGTVRIAARAFYGASVEGVTMPTTLAAIGDRAFYNCENLAVVIFKGYKAPLLEEEYSAEYANYDELPFTGELRIYEGEDPIKGLGIVPFYMWNATSGWNNFYFGATFVDRIGHTKGNLVMVKPVNGENYTSFVFTKYFGTITDGSTAATEATINVISLINALPKDIDLSHKEMVEKVSSAYNNLPMDQQVLVREVNYEKLDSALSMIKYLEDNLAVEPPIEDDPVEETKQDYASLIAIISLSVVVVALGAYVLLDKFVLVKKVAVGNKTVKDDESVEE